MNKRHENEPAVMLAEVTGWGIPPAEVQSITNIYEGIAGRTTSLRQLDLTDVVPAIMFEA